MSVFQFVFIYVYDIKSLRRTYHGLIEIICPFDFKGRSGAVNPPVLENLDNALMLPALPI